MFNDFNDDEDEKLLRHLHLVQELFFLPKSTKCCCYIQEHSKALYCQQSK